MAYSIIQPPFTLKFPEMSKPDLKAYYEWFSKMLPERIAELEAEVRRSTSHTTWNADFTRESFDALGDWFAGQVETRPRSAEELASIKGRSSIPIKVSESELTNRTFSLAMDIGMYLGKAVLTNVPGTRWEQVLVNNKHADYGQAVVTAGGPVPMNPVDLLVTLSYGIAQKMKSGGRLRELYDIWSKNLASR